MGNVFTQNEEPYKTSKQRDTHRISDKVVSFAKSKDYLRIYIAKEGDTVQKIFTDRDKKKVKKHTLVTRVTRKMFKKTSKVYILHKNIDALLYFIVKMKDNTLKLIPYELTSNTKSDILSKSETVTLDGFVGIYGFVVFVPSLDSDAYKTYPQDMRNLIVREKNNIKTDALKLKTAVEKDKNQKQLVASRIQLAVKKEKQKMVKKLNEQNSKKQPELPSKVKEGFSVQEMANIMWSADGTMRRTQ